ncbi:MAG: glycoside hydrolase family 97 catalytic domain-containing protein [Bacteroidaceae bacterium]|nr:glycoside hydrolase family 97 catalytic domain-containing protein [Bacteroidaceae bacterium]
MKHPFLFLAAFALAAMISPSSASAQTTRVLSPDGLTYLDVKFADGKLSYSAGYRTLVKGKKKGAKVDTLDVPMLLDSPLGVYTNVADFSKELTLVETQRPEATVKHNYHLRQGKQSEINSEENGLCLVLTTPKAKKSGVRMAVQFSVFNNNIAYRYRFLQGGEAGSIIVNGEASGFRFPTDATAFICPQSDPMIGWKRTKPSYEEGYIWDEPITTRSQYGRGWTFPCLFHEGDKGWVLVNETGVTSNYCGSHLSDATPDGLFTIAFPMEGENNGFGSTGAQMGLGNSKTNAYDGVTGFTPWRTITFGPTLKPIVETTIAWDVVEPLYEPSIDYQGSRNTWSWILWQDASINYNDQVAFIDLAAALGWEGCLIDGGWYENIGRAGMEKLFAYCKQKGVRPWVWYNSNGGWNDAPQCARQAMHNSIVRKQEMKWLRDGGVAGIKVDFFAGDKQETMRLYEGILSDANDYGIQVIFHGCTLPRGWERMYPNYCSSEAVLASENLYFSQDFCNMEARHACLHPFVRNTVASMEYGGTALQKRLHREPNKGNTRRTSDVFELGTAIAFQSSGQNFALTPRNLTEQPAFEIDFMRQVPTQWDETRFIDGYPGKYIVLARRSGDRWYVCALNGQKQVQNVKVELPMLAGKQVNWLSDGPDGKSPSAQQVTLDKRGTLRADIPGECAVVLY